MKSARIVTDAARLTVCLVDDDEIMQDLVSRHISRLGFEVTVASGPQIALEEIDAGRLDVVISDLYMPNMDDGLEFLATVTKRYPNLPIVLMSSEMSQGTQDTLLAAGAFACLTKPVGTDDIAGILDKVAARNRDEPMPIKASG